MADYTLFKSKTVAKRIEELYGPTISAETIDLNTIKLFIRWDDMPVHESIDLGHKLRVTTKAMGFFVEYNDPNGIFAYRDN
jgi:hypothetical protein